MFCRNCGTQNKDGARFCANCGTPLMVAPTMETPVAEAPMMETPIVDVPVMEAPVDEVPAVEVPVMEAPVDEVPAVEVPVMEASVDEVPAVEVPVMEAPVDEVPAVEVPVMETPVDEVPVVEVPVEAFVEPVNANVDINDTQIPYMAPTQQMQFEQPMQQEPYMDPTQQMQFEQPMQQEPYMDQAQQMQFEQPIQQMPYEQQTVMFNQQPVQQMPYTDQAQQMQFDQQPMQQMPYANQPQQVQYEQPMQQAPYMDPTQQMPYGQPMQQPVNDKKAEKAAKKAEKQAAKQAANQSNNNAQQAKQEKPKKKGLKIAIILGSILLVLGGAAAAYLFAPLPFKWPMTRLSRNIEASKTLFNEASKLYGDNNTSEANAKFDEAIAKCEDVISIDPSNYEAYLTAIYAYEYKDDKAGMQGVYNDFKAQLQAEKSADKKAEKDDNVGNVKADIFLTAPAIFNDADKVITELNEGVTECDNAKKVDFDNAFSDQYVIKGDNDLDANNYKEALDNYRQALDYNGNNNTAVENGGEAVNKIVEELMATGDYEEVKKFAEEINDEGIFYVPELDEAVSEIEKMEAEQQAYYDYMNQFYEAMAYEDLDALESLVINPTTDQYAIERAAIGKRLMYIMDNPLSDTGYGVEVFESNGKKVVYLGDFVDGVREGYGTVYSNASSYYNFGGCDWKNDAPNGYGYLVEATKNVYSSQYSGNLVDGLWDGYVSVEIDDYDTGHHYSMGFNASKGYPTEDVTEEYSEEFGVDIDDPEFKIYGYDSDEANIWRVAGNSRYSWGFPGFGDIN